MTVDDDDQRCSGRLVPKPNRAQGDDRVEASGSLDGLAGLGEPVDVDVDSEGGSYRSCSIWLSIGEPDSPKNGGLPPSSSIRRVVRTGDRRP